MYIFMYDYIYIQLFVHGLPMKPKPSYPKGHFLYCSLPGIAVLRWKCNRRWMAPAGAVGMFLHLGEVLHLAWWYCQ